MLTTHQSQNRIQSVDASLQMLAKQSTFVHKQPHKEKGVQNRLGLRSCEDDLMLEVPHTLKKTYVSRSFSVYGPVLWNRLPYNSRSQNTLQKFNSLKTHLFIRDYNV